MNLPECTQECRRDFIAHGPEKHYACPRGNASGMKGGAGCLMAHFAWTARRLGMNMPPFVELEQEWRHVHGEYPIVTNELGFDACVAAFDAVLLHLESSARPSKAVHSSLESSITHVHPDPSGTGGRAASTPTLSEV